MASSFDNSDLEWQLGGYFLAAISVVRLPDTALGQQRP